MRISGSHILVRLCLALALITQGLIPLSHAVATENGSAISGYICNPTGKQLSSDAKDQIKRLLALVDGDAQEEPTTPSLDHCSNCIVGDSGIFTLPTGSILPADFMFTVAVYFGSDDSSLFTARGPPLGGRAPPQPL